MLTGAHLLLTYSCNIGCDHCFLYCGPEAQGTFTVEQIEQTLGELVRLGTVESVAFEGGEPFLYYDRLLEGVRLARRYGFKASIVTNASWAISEEAVEELLQPLIECSLGGLTVSDDAYHHGDKRPSPAEVAVAVATRLGMKPGTIRVEPPSVRCAVTPEGERGEPILGGGVMFRGRAVELTAGLPRKSWEQLDECTHEKLAAPKRVHLDAFGNVHLCQGLLMGNMWRTPLSELVRGYDASAHPLCRWLIEGGPARLAQVYGLPHEERYVDDCHFCYSMRLALMERFPELLGPRQVYGLT